MGMIMEIQCDFETRINKFNPLFQRISSLPEPDQRRCIYTIYGVKA